MRTLEVGRVGCINRRVSNGCKDDGGLLTSSELCTVLLMIWRKLLYLRLNGLSRGRRGGFDSVIVRLEAFSAPYKGLVS